MVEEFMKGFVIQDDVESSSRRMFCSECKNLIKTFEEIYTDGSQIDYHLCEYCYKMKD